MSQAVKKVQPYRGLNPEPSDYRSDALSSYPAATLTFSPAKSSPSERLNFILVHANRRSPAAALATKYHNIRKMCSRTGLEPGILVLPFRCSTNWGIRPPLSHLSRLARLGIVPGPSRDNRAFYHVTLIAGLYSKAVHVSYTSIPNPVTDMFCTNESWK